MGVLSDNRSQIVNGGLISASFVSDVYDVLTGNAVENLNLSGSVNITGSLIGNLTGTADSASYVETAQTASYVLNSVSASYSMTAVTASHALNAVSSSYAETASYSVVTLIDSSSLADSASYAVTASYALNAANLLSQKTIIGSSELANMRSTGVYLLPEPDAGTWQDVKDLIYKYTYGSNPYSGFDSNNLLTIFGGGVGVKYQIYTTRDIFLSSGTGVVIWKQYPQTREESSFLAFNPAGVTAAEPPARLTAFLSRENLTGGDGVLEIEVIYEVKTI